MTPFDRHLQAARGWLALGAPLEAERELGDIAPEMRLDVQVLELRADIYEACAAWDQLRIVALMLVEAQPKQVRWWRSLARSNRHCRSLQEATATLMDAVMRFPTEPTIHYDLACCEAVVGNLKLARINLAEAIRLDPKFRDLARVDADLAPLHGEIP